LNQSTEYHITNQGNLRAGDPHPDKKWWGDPKEESIHSFFLPSLAHHHTTDYLRWFCNTHHPEVNLDDAFQAGRPGVYASYQERFGFDYADEVPNMLLELLKAELRKRGCRLSFE